MSAFIDVETSLSRGYRGALAETHSNLRSGLMTESCPSGVCLAVDSSLDRTIALKVVDSAADKIVGIGVYQPFRSPDTLGNELVEDRLENYADRGVIWTVCEEAVNSEDPVYVRHTANGTGKLQLGAVRNDSDGGSVTVFTVNTATNTSEYKIVLDGISFTFTSDGSALDSEVATGLAAAIDAHAAYTATASTNTFTVTRVSGADVVVTSLDSRITGVSGAKCVKLEGAVFAEKSSAAGLAKVKLNLPA